jgi:ABC-type antimicrobial peptide transport system permease subunit
MEYSLLGVLGGTLGLLVAAWSLDGLLTLLPGAMPPVGTIRIDGAVLGFALGITLLTGLVFGLAPAWQASRPDLERGLKSDRLVGMGLLVGLAAALATARVLQSLLYATSPHNPLVLAAIATIFSAVALAATWLPARRATLIDPIIALRAE